MKILISGATGFIGQNLVNTLLSKHYQIHCIIRESSDVSNISKKVIFFTYNQDIDSLINYFIKEKFDGVIHLASYFVVSHINRDIDHLIFSNIKFGVELLEASVKSNVKWFINTGTFWQNYKNEAYNPVNLYAATKEAFVTLSKYYTHTSDIVFVTIKLSDTFGPNDTRNKVFNTWKKISKTGELLEMSRGEQIIDISYIEDIVSAYDILINHLKSDKKDKFKNSEFVVTNSEKISLKNLSKIFEEILNVKLNIKWGGIDYREREIMVPYNKGKVVPGWFQKYTLEEAILKTIGKE